MMHKLLIFGITCMILGAALNLFLLITSKAAGQQQKQQRFPNKQQQGQVLDQQKQQQQLLNQNQHQGQPLYNANQVIACLNHQLAIVKAGITGALTLHNNTNGTVTAALNQIFIMNATNVLDSCILPRR
ncbi:MAG: hypothetical protein WCF23_15570 [Candidatus Nitrosopolaris sp.]